MKDNKKLPVYGIGPIYVAIIIIITIIFSVLSKKEIIPILFFPVLKIPFIIAGILLIAAGIFMWCMAVITGKIDDGLENTKLITDGIYAYVRNPIYSAFAFICTGVLLIMNNIWLLPLIFVFQLILTLMIKPTEEKWLYEFFGEEYKDYCKKVNRFFPWFRRK